MRSAYMFVRVYIHIDVCVCVQSMEDGRDGGKVQTEPVARIFFGLFASMGR